MPLGDGLALAPLPPQEAIAFFRAKGYAVGFDWRDVWQQEHQTAFTVAKAMTADLLRDIRGAVDQALANGETFETFRQKLQPTLMDKGWWGRGVMKDPETGEEKMVQLGSPRRLRTIYDTNLRTAHSEGQWQRIQATKQSFPWLLYDGLNSEHPRQSHIPFDGKVLPADDPFWQVHMPVRAWGCKCRAVQLNQALMDQQGLAPTAPPPAMPDRDYVNQRTGEVQRIPYGVDPEFHYPPALPRGQAVAKALFDKLDQTEARVARAIYPTLNDTTRQAMGDEYRAWFDQIDMERPRRERRVIGAIPAPVLRQLAARDVHPDSAMIAVWDADLTHCLRDYKVGLGNALKPADLRALPELLQRAQAIYWDKVDPALVYAVDPPSGVPAGDQAKVLVRINMRAPMRPPGGGQRQTVTDNRVRTAGIVRRTDLSGDGRYELLWGGL